MKDDTRNGFRLGDWQVYPLRNLLVGPPGEIHIEPKVMQVLESLASNAGQVVERETLLKDIWNGRAFSDEPLTRCIATLRHALDDSPKDPEYIQTIPKSGYRLVCPVESLEQPTDDAKDESGVPGRRRIALPAFLGLILIAALYVAYRATFPGLTESPQLAVEGTTLSARPVYSIAVLPFVNMSDDPGNEYFSDGISEELMNALVKVQGLRVASRTSSFAFKDKDVDIPGIAIQLNVDYVLQGSVRKAGDNVRVTAQLVDVRTDSSLWSETYDRELKDIFAIQDEITGQIVQALKVALGAGEQEAMADAQRPTENLQAYEFYLRARHLWQRRGEDNIRRAIDLFEQATAVDPQFARAWSSLAVAHATLPPYSDALPDEQYSLAVSAAQKALALDDTLAEAYAVLGEAARFNRKWADAKAYHLRAIANEPKNSTAHQWYAEHLMGTGRNRDALEEALIANQLDPLNAGINVDLAGIYWGLADTSNVLKHGAAAWDLGHIEGLRMQVCAHLHLGEFDRAIEFAEQYADVRNYPVRIGKLFIEAKMDATKSTLFLETLAEHETALHLFDSLTGYVGFGGIDDAYRVISTNLDSHPVNIWWAFWWPNMVTFRQDPRFAGLVTELGLVDYWREHGWPDVCQPAGDSLICE